jgi:hypothetical protein
MLRFSYKSIRNRPQPIIPIRLRLGDAWRRFDVYVDSGATYTLIESRFIDPILLDYQTGKKVTIQVGSGSLIEVYLHELELQLGSERFIVFSYHSTNREMVEESNC